MQTLTWTIHTLEVITFHFTCNKMLVKENISLSFIPFPVHQWRRLPSVPEDLFRSGGLPCGSLPATLPLLPKLWTHPGRQCQWDCTPCINTTHCLHATVLQALINLRHGLFGILSFITTCLWGTVCADMVTRVFTALPHSPPSLPQRRSFSRMFHVTSPCWRMASPGTSLSVSPRFLWCSK